MALALPPLASARGTMPGAQEPRLLWTVAYGLLWAVGGGEYGLGVRVKAGRSLACPKAEGQLGLLYKTRQQEAPERWPPRGAGMVFGDRRMPVATGDLGKAGLAAARAEGAEGTAVASL